MSEKKPNEVKIEIQVDEETAQGVYANLAVVNHSDAEFTLDFIFVQPQAPRAKVRSRIVTSPKHVKRLLTALEDNLKKYEERFGPVDIGSPEDAPQAGPYH
ncbi:MAG: DUF3467 domain-containing protein [Desulfuromonadales bacterium]|nr:DUF3467 domain-containing protein [Desulfuromonadales bacterium]NIS39740.1 DUF3467 domain-containing protein [Desulfuromonadales bacterium]